MVKGQQFALTVLQAFRDAGNDTDAEVARAGGPSNSTMSKIRKVAAGVAEMDRPRGDTLEGIDRAAGWERGAAKRLWGYAESSREPSSLEIKIAEVEGTHLSDALKAELIAALRDRSEHDVGTGADRA